MLTHTIFKKIKNDRIKIKNLTNWMFWPIAAGCFPTFLKYIFDVVVNF